MFGQIFQRTELLWENIDQIAPLRVPLVLQTLQQAHIEPFFQQLEFIHKILDHRLAFGFKIIYRKGHAPDLGPLFFAEIVEKLHTASDQIGLGEKHINGKPDTELFVQFLNTPANSLGFLGTFGFVFLHQIGQTDSNHDTVNGTLATVFFE